jgi:two-component system response regulator DegU
MNNVEHKVIRVVVADDHPIVRSGIRNELARHPDIEVIGEATNGDEALSLARTLQPDVLLLDINMPGLQAVKVVKNLRELPSMPYVVVLSVCEDEEHVIALLAAGAKGYILKDEKPIVIAETVRGVEQGGLWLSPKVAQVMGRTVKGAAGDTSEKALTPRELEVLKMMTRGFDNPKIAQELSVTEATVKFHVGNIYAKLAVTSRVEAVLCALRQALVDLNSE